jgi:hypothetical protein
MQPIAAKERSMTIFPWVALASGALAVGTGGALSHQTRLDHHSGAAHADYRGDIVVEHRQVGNPAPGGRQSTLSCRWTAGLVVNRQARHASGSTHSRSFERANVIEGSRPGWCDSHRSAIAQEIARRHGELRDHLVATAQEDHAVLRAELDQLQG